jgi:hypothetical protein
MKGKRKEKQNPEEPKGYASVTQLYEAFEQQVANRDVQLVKPENVPNPEEPQKRGYASVTQLYKAFQQKMSDGCQLFLKIHSTLTLAQLFSQDVVWLKSFTNKATKGINQLTTDSEWAESCGREAIEGDTNNISYALLLLKPYDSLYNMLEKADAIKYCNILNDSDEALHDPVKQIAGETDKNNYDS